MRRCPKCTIIFATGMESCPKCGAAAGVIRDIPPVEHRATHDPDSFSEDEHSVVWNAAMAVGSIAVVGGIITTFIW